MGKRELANKWSGASCTLDGKPAKISGRLNDFASVNTLDGKKSYQWAWETVDQIMANHSGKFVS